MCEACWLLYRQNGADKNALGCVAFAGFVGVLAWASGDGPTALAIIVGLAVIVSGAFRVFEQQGIEKGLRKDRADRGKRRPY